MSGWIELDAHNLYVPERTVDTGVEISVGLAPDDLPEAVRGFVDKPTGRFVIEFRYFDSAEPLEGVESPSGVRLVVGRVTKRLHQIWLDVNGTGASSVRLNLSLPKVEKAIEDLASTKPFNRLKSHLRAAETAISSKATELLAGA